MENVRQMPSKNEPFDSQEDYPNLRRGGGRPRIDEGKKRGRVVAFRVSQGQYEKLERMARERGQDISDFIRGLIAEEYRSSSRTTGGTGADGQQV